jgi:diacylglycerol diphosphate phosphatase/phosphatidate phosphatase
MIGRLRPDFLARCIPEVTESGSAICKQVNKYLVEEGRRSFPSGHASTSFAGLSFIALFLAGQLRIYDGTAMALKLAACFSPIVLAIAVTISRVTDHRHHWHDVAAGGALGLLITLITYPLYFPSVFSPLADQIYTTRVDKIRTEALGTNSDNGSNCPSSPV